MDIEQYKELKDRIQQEMARVYLHFTPEKAAAYLVTNVLEPWIAEQSVIDIKELRHINTFHGYWDHYYYFTGMTRDHKSAYELTEKILLTNHHVNRYQDYDSFRKARYKYAKRDLTVDQSNRKYAL